MDKLNVYAELANGGEWLAAAREWIKCNIHGGDRLCWNSGEPVQIPFCKLQDLSLKVAIAAVEAERRRAKAEEEARPAPELSEQEKHQIMSSLIAEWIKETNSLTGGSSVSEFQVWSIKKMRKLAIRSLIRDMKTSTLQPLTTKEQHHD